MTERKTEPEFDVDAVIERVQFAFRPAGKAWTGGDATYAVNVDARGFAVTPYHRPGGVPRKVVEGEPRRSEPRGHERDGSEPRLGSGEPVEGGAIRFGGSVVRRGTRLAGREAKGRIDAQDGHLVLERGGVEEHFRNTADGVEQSWSFASRPAGEGGLTVRIPLQSGRYRGVTETGLHFEDGKTGLGVRYGHATWVDARGTKTSIRARFEGGAVVLHVPADVVDGAAYPALLDPVIGPEFEMDEPVFGPPQDIQAAPSTAWGGTNWLVVWSDFRIGGMSDVYGARVSAEGVVLDTAGIPIVVAGYPQHSPAVASDGTNWLVVWQDGRSTSTYDIYGARVSGDGVVQDAAGIRISPTAAIVPDQPPAVAWGGTSWLVVWEDLRNGSSSDVYGARVSGSGVVLDPAGIPVTTAANDQTAPSVAWDGTNWLVVWEDRQGGPVSDIFGARVSGSGVVQDVSGIPIATAEHYQTTPSVASDGTNWLVVWADNRSGSSYDIYGARVSGSGVVQDPSGFPVSTAAGNEFVPEVAWGGTDWLVVWADRRSGSTYDVYAARVSGSGVVQDPAGIPVSNASKDQWSPSVAWDGTTWLVVWQDGRNGSSDDIYGARVSGDGIVQDAAGFAVATAANAQSVPAVAWGGTSWLVVWTDQRSGNSDLYGARVSGDGGVQDPFGIALSTAAGSQLFPSVAWDGTTWLVVWQDDRSGTGSDIYGARVSGDGIVQDPTGIALSTAANAQYAPSVARGETDWLVVWQDHRSGTGSDIYGARVSGGGVVQDPSGIALSTAANNQRVPAVAWDGTSWLVVWQDHRSGTGSDIYGARVNGAGVVQDPSGIALSTAANDQNAPSVAWGGTNFLVVWHDRRNGSAPDIYGTRVSGDGVVQDPTGIAISTATSQQLNPSVAWDGTTWNVVWEDLRSASGYDLYGARVGAGGVVLDPSGIALSTDPFFEESPVVASRGGGISLVVYVGFDASPARQARRVRARRISLNAAPVADTGTFATNEDTPVSVSLAASDAETEPLTYAVVAGPVHGTLSGTAPNLTYTPATNFHGADGFTFRVNDGTQDSVLATVTITVTAVNDAPVANTQSVTTTEDAAATVVLTGSDVDDDALSFVVLETPEHGTLSGTAPHLTYTPDADYSGPDRFTFAANDGEQDSAAVEVTLSVTAVNDAPVANTQEVTTAEDTAAALTLTGHDVEGTPLTVAVLEGPTHGTLTGTPPDLTYTPAENYVGPDSVTFAVHDGERHSTAATVAITVTAVNDAPLANAQDVTTGEDTAAVLTLTGRDVEGAPLTVAVLSGPAHGTLAGTPPDLTYTPAANYVGPDIVTFRVHDGEFESTAATVAITVTAVNDAPVANTQEVTTDEDAATTVLLAGADVDGDPLSFAIVAEPEHGTLSGTAPNLTYTPSADYHGADRFTFKANDGAADSIAVEVTLSVVSVNDPPIATPQTLSVGQGATTVVLAGTDVDGDALTFAIAQTPAVGSLAGTPPEVTCTPPPDHRGAVSFTFTASDGQLTSIPATVTLTINNAAPVVAASASTLQPKEGENVLFAATAEDPGGDTLSFAWDFGDETTSDEPNPTHAYANEGTYTAVLTVSDGVDSTTANTTLTVSNAAPLLVPLEVPAWAEEARSLDFHAAATDEGSADVLSFAWDFGDGTAGAEGADVNHAWADDGTYTVTLTVSDGVDSTTATREMQVTNLPPQVDAVTAQTVQAGTPLAVTLRATDVAGEADPLTWTLAEGPGAISADGTYSWTPATMDEGLHVVKVRATDDDGGVGETVFRITVTVAPAAEAEGCGCSGSSSAPAFAALALLPLARRRTRRAAAERDTAVSTG